MKPYDWFEAGLFCGEDEPLFATPEMEAVADPWGLSLTVVALLLLFLAVGLAVAFALSLE